LERDNTRSEDWTIHNKENETICDDEDNATRDEKIETIRERTI